MAGGKPLRADARRNYDALIAQARTAFREQGTNAYLEDIARRAGVGIGTLYRHFPDRKALVDAVFRTEADGLVALAEELSGARDPAAALVTWLGAMLAHYRAYHGLAGPSLEPVRQPAAIGKRAGSGRAGVTSSGVASSGVATGGVATGAAAMAELGAAKVTAARVRAAEATVASAEIVEAEKTSVGAATPAGEPAGREDPVRAAGGVLLARAQNAGVMRGDTDILDVLRLTNAISLVAERYPDDPDLADRLLRLTIDGLRAPRRRPATRR